MTLQQSPVTANLPAVDLARAKKFYSEQLGLTPMPDAMPGVALFGAGSGTTLMLYEREATKADHTVASFEVQDIEGTVKDLKAKGVIFEEYDFPDFKTVDSIATMGPAKAAWFKDTEDNILCLHQG